MDYDKDPSPDQVKHWLRFQEEQRSTGPCALSRYLAAGTTLCCFLPMDIGNNQTPSVGRSR
jgi:hypothetical protein